MSLRTFGQLFVVFALLLVTASAPGQNTPVYAWRNFAGLPGSAGTNDGTGTAARFNAPNGVAVDSAGNVFVADTFNHTIRKVTSDGVVTTLAGSAGQHGNTDGTGSAARFFMPTGVAVDSVGTVYVADYYNFTIRKVTSAGVVTTLAGSASNAGTNDGTGGAARFFYPYGVTVDSAGNKYVADSSNDTIRKITNGVVSTLAGSPGVYGSADGTGSAARFKSPDGLAADNAGNVYVADTGNFIIRKVTSAGEVTTFAGSSGQYGSTDGTGSAARFYTPYAVAADTAGNVYVADYQTSIIRRITSARVVTTIGGSAGYLGSADGTGSAAQFAEPSGVAVDSTGCLYVADMGNHRISKGTPLPTLTCRLSGSSVVVSWPSPSTGFVLQQNADVDNASGWSGSGYTISDDGTTKSITITPPPSRLFFRLVAN